MQDGVHAILQAANLYMYCAHNPVRWIDPSGKFFLLPFMVPPVKALITATLAAGAAYAGTQLAINAVEAAQTAPATATAPAQSASSAGNSVLQTYAAARENSTQPPPVPARPALTPAPPDLWEARDRPPPSPPVSIGGSTPASPPPPGNGNNRGNNNRRITTTNKNIDATRGEPNSITRQVDSSGRIIKERHFGPDGRAVQDIHFTNHGNPETHPNVPHRHNWDWSNPLRPILR